MESYDNLRRLVESVDEDINKAKGGNKYNLHGDDWGFCFNTEFISFDRDPCACAEPGHFIDCETVSDADSGTGAGP